MTSTWGDPALISGHATRRPRTEAEAKADVARKHWDESIAVIRSKLAARQKQSKQSRHPYQAPRPLFQEILQNEIHRDG